MRLSKKPESAKINSACFMRIVIDDNLKTDLDKFRKEFITAKKYSDFIICINGKEYALTLDVFIERISG